ncbi:MAG: hypothetical protein ABSE76_00655 [Minisyncoccia bacterium]|jgi:hypothetical protein
MKRITNNYQPYLNRALVCLVVILTASVFLYCAFLLEAVANAAAKTTAERNTTQLTEQLSSLENQYLALTQSLTPERAATLGLVIPTNVTSVYAHGESGSLSFGQIK